MWVVLLTVLSLISVSAGQTVANHDQVVACYVSTWAVYRPAKGRFTLDNVDPTLCTHLIYAFTGIDERTFRIKSLDPDFDINKGGFQKAVSLRQRNPKLKVSIAVGGWIEGSEKYSAMSSTPTNRKSFIDSVVELLHKYKFDGLDLDWEYPANRGGKPKDKENFVLLVKELKRAFSGKNWILTAAVGAGKSIIDSAYDLPRLSEHLDFIHLMSYDYHGKWDLKTGHNAPLYPRADENELEAMLNVNYSVRYYLKQGVPLNKFVLGLGVYGRTFLLNDTTNPGIGAPARKSAFSGPYTREDGFLGYNEICEKQISERGWSIAWQSAHQAPYMFKDKMWISFDDTNSLGLKVAFAQRLGIAGVMVWSIDTDDFRGECSQVRFPLLRSINRNMALHAKNRFEEKISVTKLPVPVTSRPTGAPLPDIKTTPAHIPASKPTPAHIPAPRPTPTHIPAPRPTPAHIPAPRPTPAHIPAPKPTLPHIPTKTPTGVPLPDVHSPDIPAKKPIGVPLPDVPSPDIPAKRPSGAPLPDVPSPDIPAKRPIGVPLPDVPSPDIHQHIPAHPQQPSWPHPDITPYDTDVPQHIPVHPHQPSFPHPDIIPYETDVHQPDVHQPHRPIFPEVDYGMDDLDKDKPGITDIDFEAGQGNVIDDSRYDPAAEQGGTTAAASTYFASSFTIAILVLSCIYA